MLHSSQVFFLGEKNDDKFLFACSQVGKQGENVCFNFILCSRVGERERKLNQTKPINATQTRVRRVECIVNLTSTPTSTETVSEVDYLMAHVVIWIG